MEVSEQDEKGFFANQRGKIMRKMRKAELWQAVVDGVCLVLGLFLFFWVIAQVIDPQKYFLITQVPWEITLFLSLAMVLGIWVTEKHAPNQEQTIKSIKKGREILWP